MTTAVFLAVFALLVVGCLFKPSLAVGVLIYGFAAEQLAQAHSFYFVQKSWIGNVVVGLSVVFALLSKQIRGQKPLANLSYSYYLGIALLMYCSASTLWSLTPGGHTSVIGHAPYIVLFMILAPLLISSAEDLQKSMLMCSILGLLLFAVLLSTTSMHEFGRKIVLADAQGLDLQERSDGNPLAVASAAGYAAICTAFVRVKKGQLLLNLFRWLLIVLYLVVIVRSGSRGQLLGCLLVIGTFLPIHHGVKDIGKVLRLAVVGVVLVAIAIGIYQTMLVDNKRWSLSYAEEGSSGRLGAWYTMLMAWLGSNPASLLLGLGSFSSSSLLTGYPHNLTVEMLTEQGVFGFSLYTAFLLSAALAFKKLLTVYKKPEERAAIVTLGALAMFELILHQKQSSFFGIQTLYLFVIGIGRCAAHAGSPEGRASLQTSAMQKFQSFGYAR